MRLLVVICALLAFGTVVNALERSHHHHRQHHTQHSHQKHHAHHQARHTTSEPPDCSEVHLPLFKSPYPKDQTTELVILHYNDVYEMTNMARLATVSYCLRQAYITEYGPDFNNLMIMFGGDIISFCAFNDVQDPEDNNRKLEGKQLIKLMNFMAQDYTYKYSTFGNHEFDYDSYKPLEEALEQSDYKWVSSSISLKDTDESRWSETAKSKVNPFEIVNIGGLNVFISGITVDKTKKSYALFQNLETAVATFKSHLDSEVNKKAHLTPPQAIDVTLALNHLGQMEDMRVALSIPDIDLVVGGHDHKNALFYRGLSKATTGLFNTPISRADLNANSVFIHQIFVQKGSSGQSGYSLKPTFKVVRSSYMSIDTRIPEHPDALAIINKYKEKGLAFYRSTGLVPDDEDLNTKLIQLQQGWNAMEDRLKIPDSTMAKWACNSMFEYTSQHKAEFLPAPKSDYTLDYALFPALTIRMDDFFGPGVITWLDLLRLLPRATQFVVLKVNAKAWKKIDAYYGATKNTEAYTITCRGFGNKAPVAPGRDVYFVTPEFVRSTIFGQIAKKDGKTVLKMGEQCNDVVPGADVECLGSLDKAKYPMVKAAKEYLHKLENRARSAALKRVEPDGAENGSGEKSVARKRLLKAMRAVLTGVKLKLFLDERFKERVAFSDKFPPTEMFAPRTSDDDAFIEFATVDARDDREPVF